MSVDLNMLEGLGLASTNSSKANTGKRDELGQEEFFKLMITQLQNQDPFEPMENGDFLGQIAQFGTVNGIGELQKSFESIAKSVQSAQTLQAASLVDREVLVPVDMAGLGPEGGVRGALDLKSSAEEVTVGVYDAAGALVRRLPMGAQASGMQSFHWDGMTDQGERAPPGVYEFRANAVRDGSSEQPELLLNARVESVRTDQRNGGIKLQIEGFGEMDFSQVRRIG
ncbi:flagellar hook capping protein [Ectothiorhodospira haloalkaliphila]|uniref:Basal-body rod modification protein FlgD n=1 Tax=Ectothiorhodospira haloalkaliphila TaxID=421628 RepID=W8KRF0_9GAMM|nr:flagellar hook assembly protein FlgD [Ectothiorhodospira haloalkaliphila]AHK79592.1 flagellar hook capping protein [Ectothiorhodospira haloalkaliphila]